jgi:hypothetical protein
LARLFQTFEDVLAEHFPSSPEIVTEVEKEAAADRIRRGRGKSQHSLDLIDTAYDILAEIQPASVRATAYQLFRPHHLIKNMGTGETAKVSRLLVDAREAETIPWGWIVDDTRQIRGSSGWDDPERFIEAALAQYRKDYWQFQPYHVEIWTEKGTVTSTLDPVLEKYGIRSRIMKGFGSASAIKKAADYATYSDKPCKALYVGDWDPSGLYMSEIDLPKRLLKYGDPARQWDIQRIALDIMDIEAGDVSSFPLSSKTDDPRRVWYSALMRENLPHLASKCWELDALSPVRLRDRVELHIQLLLDDAAWARCTATEALERESLESVLGTWKDVASIDGLLLKVVSDKMQNIPVRTPVLV